MAFKQPKHTGGVTWEGPRNRGASFNRISKGLMSRVVTKWRPNSALFSIFKIQMQYNWMSFISHPHPAPSFNPPWMDDNFSYAPSSLVSDALHYSSTPAYNWNNYLLFLCYKFYNFSYSNSFGFIYKNKIKFSIIFLETKMRCCMFKSRKQLKVFHMRWTNY